MLLHYPYFPIAVLKVLAPQLPHRIPIVVGRLNPGIKENLAATGQQPIIELVILVAHQLFIKDANAPEDITWPGSEINCIYPFFMVGIMESRSSDTEGRTCCLGHRVAKP